MFYLSGNFNFNSKHNEFGFMCHLAIIMEVDIDRSPSSEYPPWSLLRVTGHTLDPGKHWYVLTKTLCGLRPKEIAASEMFRHYEDEIQSVAPKDLKPATRGCAEPSVRRIFVWSLCWITSTANVCSSLLSTFWEICLCCGLAKRNWSGLWLTVKFWREKLSFGSWRQRNGNVEVQNCRTWVWDQGTGEE